MAVSLAVLAALAVLAFTQLQGSWWFQDTRAYWDAAVRLREGEPLYPPLANEDASAVYRYAPWFAFAWLPLTFFPEVVVFAGWTAVLAGAVLYCAWTAVRPPTAAGVALALLTLALLAPAAASGNVQPLLVATLVWGLERRSAPLWIAVATSLKAAPIVLVAVLLGRREWLRAGATLALAVLLVAPMLLFDLSAYPLKTGAAMGPIPHWLSVPLAAALAVLAGVAARTRHAWLAAGAAVVLAIPRWSYYQASFTLVGLARRPGRGGDE